jgi:hypothetical protein
MDIGHLFDILFQPGRTAQGFLDNREPDAMPGPAVDFPIPAE